MAAAAAAALLLQACAPEKLPAQAAAAAAQPTQYTFEIAHEYPHDPEAFTQGLIFRDGVLFESTGLNGRSSLRKVALETGEVLQRHDVSADYFAEGLTDWGAHLLQLTWTTNVTFVYDLASFKEVRRFSYAGEGWGLTHDGQRLIMSDGTPNLRYLDPATFEELSRFTVRDGNGASVDDLNELEFVKGLVYANVWLTDRIAIIDPESGRVTGWIDLAGLRTRVGASGDDVLNRIAYDAAGDRLFVTGKLWPKLFEIRIRPR